MPEELLLGAHVSTAGGVARAPARGAAIGARAMQIFTKTPNQWREPAITDQEAARFRAAVTRARLRVVVAHDSYLINLASPDPALRRRSVTAFRAELGRCHTLGIPFVVTHPGNYITRRAAGLRRNADAYAEALDAVPGPMILLEHLQCLHLNDSATPFASRRDRHALIGDGSLGPEPFRRVMRDPRFARVVKVIETPKGDDPVRTDRRMLRRLRAYAARRTA